MKLLVNSLDTYVGSFKIFLGSNPEMICLLDNSIVLINIIIRQRVSGDSG